ncbi:MAG: glycerate kinase [Saprospiraceae bacterium]
MISISGVVSKWLHFFNSNFVSLTLLLESTQFIRSVFVTRTTILKILLVPDKFKGSLTAEEVCKALSIGILRYNKTIEIINHPMSDGGEGSIDILASSLKLSKVETEVIDSKGREISTYYYENKKSAYIELSKASGLLLVPTDEQNPRYTSTFGTGQQILHAIKKGNTTINLFIGGSATNDAGIGIAAALGFKFYDEKQLTLLPIGDSLVKIVDIDSKDVKIDFSKITINCFTDVTNVLFGPNGAAYGFGAQKGASAEDIEYLDIGLQEFANVVNDKFSVDISAISGGGAAGGIGAGLFGLCNANIKSGWQMISESTNLEYHILQSDLIISGEGRLDNQSINGKVTGAILKLAKKHNKPVLLIVGDSIVDNLNLKIEIKTIMSRSKDIEDSMQNASSYLSEIIKDYLTDIK